MYSASLLQYILMDRNGKITEIGCTESIVQTVGEKEAKTTFLPSLYDVIDLDHLERSIETDSTPVPTTFQYHGYTEVGADIGGIAVADYIGNTSPVDV